MTVSKDMKSRIVVVDDDRDILEMLVNLLQRRGFEPRPFFNPVEALQWIREHGSDVIVADYLMPRLNGLDLLSHLQEARPAIPVVVISGNGTIETAVEAMKRGAYDFIEKPLHPEHFLLVLSRASEVSHLRRERESLQSQLGKYCHPSGIVFRSKIMGNVMALLKRLATSDVPILIEGLTGTGKEMIAKAIHAESPRASHPFLPVDCSSLPESLLESELFGHERGAFTGAVHVKRGLLEEVRGGTLFLDEVTNMSLSVQSKLLRVLQDQRIRRIGGTETIEVDFRLISASNVPLRQEAAEGKFREDLFYRLNGATIVLPHLAARREDIPLLALHFLRLYSARFKRDVATISSTAMRLLLDYSWPGNIRQLENVIMRAISVAETEEIQPQDLPEEVRAFRVALSPHPDMVLDTAIESHIQAALKTAQGNKTQAARLLGITRRSLYRRLEKHEIFQ